MEPMLLCLGTIVMACATGSAPRGPIPILANLVDASDLICIGVVEEVVVVELPEPIHWAGSQARIARVAVERVLKGPESMTVAHQEAWGRGLCDGTRSRTEIGVRALLFLSRQGDIARSPETVRTAVREAIGSDDIFRNWQSGNGIMTILDEGGEEYVGSSGVPMVLHASLPYRARLTDVVGYVEELCRFPLSSVSVHARDRWPVSSWFDLRILPDGQARLATGLPSEEHTRVFQIEPQAWRSLESELAALVGANQRIVGDPSQGPGREIALQIDGATLRFVEPREWSPPADASLAQRLALRDSLRAWTLVRVVAELPSPDPHAEKDRGWLGPGR